MIRRHLFKISFFVAFIAAAIVLTHGKADAKRPSKDSGVYTSFSTDNFETDSTGNSSEKEHDTSNDENSEVLTETKKQNDIVQNSHEELYKQHSGTEMAAQDTAQKSTGDNSGPQHTIEKSESSVEPSEPIVSEQVNSNNVVTASSGQTYTYTKKLDMRATAYTYTGTHLDTTASGRPVQVGVVAADFSVIPMNTEVYIVAADGSWEYGYAVVGDTGVKGNTIDIFLETEEDCINFGVRKAIVYILE